MTDKEKYIKARKEARRYKRKYVKAMQTIKHYENLIEYSRDFDCSITKAEMDLLVLEDTKCTDCILDTTDACPRGAGRAIDDEICEKFMEEE